MENPFAFFPHCHPKTLIFLKKPKGIDLAIRSRMPSPWRKTLPL